MYQHFHDIVNHPPYVQYVEVNQPDRCIYTNQWEDIEDENTKRIVARKPNRNKNCKDPVDTEQTMKVIIKFGNNDYGSEERVTVNNVTLRNKDDVQDITPFGTLDPSMTEWTATFKPSTKVFVNEDSVVTVEIDAKDLHNHYKKRNHPGDVLDSDPSTPARASSKFAGKGTNNNYNWNKGYKPGPDTNHKIGSDVNSLTAVIIDSTDSMAQNDPNSERLESAKQFVDNAEEGTRIAVISFYDVAPKIVERTILSKEDRTAIKQSISTIGLGDITDINTALNSAFAVLNENNETNIKSAILVTDGIHNDGDYKEESHQQYAEAGWSVRTIGLGDGVDENFLQRIADETNGGYEQLESAAQLTAAYRRIARETSGQKLTVESSVTLQPDQSYQEVVTIQPNQASATFFSEWPDGTVNMSITPPSGPVISAASIESNISQAQEDGYELYTIEDPEPGEWTVRFDTDSVNATDVTFEATSKPNNYGTREIYLAQGWNLLSTRVAPLEEATAKAFGSIAGKYNEIRSFEEGDQVFNPDIAPLSTLTQVDGEHGYWIHMKEYALLTLRGVPLTADDTKIQLEQGWNLVSYLENESLAVPDALASIAGKYSAVLGYENGATSHYPQLSTKINTLNTMRSFQAYWIHMNEPAELDYAQNTKRIQPGTEAVPYANQPQQPLSAEPTTKWLNIYSTNSTVDGQPIKEHTTIITAWGEDGRKLAETRSGDAGSYGILTIYQDDPATAEVDGARPGERIDFTINYQRATVANGMESVWTEHGDLLEIDLAVHSDGTNPTADIPLPGNRPVETITQFLPLIVK